jgi:hypothetical protein
MRSFFKLYRPLVLFVLAGLLLIACTKITSTDLGAGLIPPIDGVNTLDTIMEVITDTYEDTDSVRVYITDQHVVGTITNDPIFGRTTASMYLELRPPSYPFYVIGNKDSVVVDSAVLILSYKGVFGDSTQPVRLTVSEVDQSTPLDPVRNYPVRFPSAYPINIGAALASPVNVDVRRLADTVKNRYEVATNQIRIKLRQDVAQRFLQSYDSTNAYKSDSLFRKNFAGFALTADQNAPANALIQISLSDTNTKFALYYSTSSTGATVRDTGVSYFRFNTTNGGSACFVTRNRAGSEIANRITTNGNPKSDSLVYVQTMPGTRVRVRIPGLKNLSNRIIHRAELIAEQVPDDNNYLTIDQQMRPPRYLLLSTFDSVTNKLSNLPNDYIYSTSGGGPNIVDFGGAAFYRTIAPYSRVAVYNFNLSRYVQGIVTRKDSVRLLQISAPVNDSIKYIRPHPQVSIADERYFLVPGMGNDLAIGRVRLGGGTHSRFRMRLRIIYSRI